MVLGIVALVVCICLALGIGIYFATRGGSPSPDTSSPAPSPDMSSPAPSPDMSSVVVNGADAGPAGTIAGINWDSHLNYDYPRNTMKYIPNQTRTQCATACANDPSCKAFSTGGLVTDKFAGDCSLKNNFITSNLTPNTNLNVFSKP
jgi:PAN-like domain